ncbi:MAG: hypothetical protein RLZZ608_1282 [Actinomycetota bacterium]|jgi:hypothetical protein
MIPLRQVRALYDDETVTVYQAYSPQIAVPAAAAGTFVNTPFKLERMTWIKPSFLWMMYRSGWATKPGQEHVLEIRMLRTGFEHALSQSCLSHFDPTVYSDEDEWKARRDATTVRVQWDPERDAHHTALTHRSLQLGLAGEATRRFAAEWVVGITDITPKVRELHRSLGHDSELAGLPAERPYPLSEVLRATIGAS